MALLLLFLSLRCLDVFFSSELSQNLRRLLSISKVIRQKRVEAGALQLASPDVQIIRETIADEKDNEGGPKRRKTGEGGREMKSEEKEAEDDDAMQGEGSEEKKKKQQQAKKGKGEGGGGGGGEQEKEEIARKECHADEVTEEASGGDIALYQARDTNRMVSLTAVEVAQ